MSFKNKVVIITGASSGIGAATAKLFAKELAKVVMVGRNTEKLKNVADDIIATVGEEPFVIKADVSNDEEAKDVIIKTVNKFEKIDVLINNAGFLTSLSILNENYMSEFDKVFATNLRGVAVLTHAAVRHLIKTRGNIINISSISSCVTGQNISYYSAAKAGLDQFSKCLALELAGNGVRVNVIQPGPVKSDLVLNMGATQEQSLAAYKSFTDLSPLKRISEAEEIGELMLFLASDKAISITGSRYTIDCGISLVGIANSKS